MMKPKGSQFSLFSDDEIDASTQSYRTAMADHVVSQTMKNPDAVVTNPAYHETLSTDNWSRSDYLTLAHNPPEQVKVTPGDSGGWYERPVDLWGASVYSDSSRSTMAHELGHHLHIANDPSGIGKRQPGRKDFDSPSPFLEGVATGVANRVMGKDLPSSYEREWVNDPDGRQEMYKGAQAVAASGDYPPVPSNRPLGYKGSKEPEQLKLDL